MEYVNKESYSYFLDLMVDAKNQLCRQDVYVPKVSLKEPVQTVISDFKYSLIMDKTPDEEDGIVKCRVTRFEHSLNTIDNIMREMWLPRPQDETYTQYLGEQCISESDGSFYAFKTLSSDNTFWNVYFNTQTKHPQVAMSNGPKVGKVFFQKGTY